MLDCEIPSQFILLGLIVQVDSVDQFVAGMSLTFEQANIDFSLYYKEQFELAGDRTTAAIMQTVLQDEIAHVRHGVNFFRSRLAPEVAMEQVHRRFSLPTYSGKGERTVFFQVTSSASWTRRPFHRSIGGLYSQQR